MITLSSASASFQQTWNDVCLENKQKEKAWISDLRANGVKAAHPEDSRTLLGEYVQFVFPHFNDDVKVGDKIALGSRFSKTRIVVCISIRPPTLMDAEKFFFRDLSEEEIHPAS